MTSIANNFLNETRNLIINPNLESERKDITRRTECVKIAAAVVIVASAILFASFASLGAFCLLFPIAYIAYEIGALANNYQKFFGDWKAAIKANWSDRQFLLHLTENAPVSRSMTKLSGLV